MIYGTASYYGHLRFEPAEATAQAAAVAAHRPPEAELPRRRSTPRSRARTRACAKGAGTPARA